MKKLILAMMVAATPAFADGPPIQPTPPPDFEGQLYVQQAVQLRQMAMGLSNVMAQLAVVTKDRDDLKAQLAAATKDQAK